MTGFSVFPIWRCALCGCVLLLAGPARALAPAVTVQIDTMATPETSSVAYPEVGHTAPARVMFQSLLLPGWGQLENGAVIKATLFFGAYAALVRQGVLLNQDKQDALGRLGGAAEEDRPELEREVDRLSNSRNAKIWFAGLTAVIAMADAYVDAHLKRFDDRMDSDIALSAEGFRVGIRWSLSGGTSR